MKSIVGSLQLGAKLREDAVELASGSDELRSLLFRRERSKHVLGPRDSGNRLNAPDIVGADGAGVEALG